MGLFSIDSWNENKIDEKFFFWHKLHPYQVDWFQ